MLSGRNKPVRYQKGTKRTEEDRFPMEGREEGGDRWEERGAGGKMNRRSLLERASSKTPYCRPPSSAGAAPHLGSRLEGIDERKGGWFSRAKHLLSPSSRVVPSFSPSFAASASAQPCSEDSARADSSRGPLQVQQESKAGITENVFNGHISGRVNQERGFCQTDKQGGGRLQNVNDGIGFANIEHRLKQKIFSRDESNGLIELLHSRTTYLAGDDACAVRFKAHSSSNAREWTYMRKSAEEKQPTQINPRFHRESVFDEVGVSPVEIAKAFMESRSSLSSDQGIHGGFLKNERSPLRGRGSAANTATCSDSPMSQICWPGAVVRADRRYFTPQSQRGRSGLWNTLQTRCPEEIFQRSLTKKRSSTPGGIHANISPILGLQTKSMKLSDLKGGAQNNSPGIMSPVSASCDVSNCSTLTPKRNSESGLTCHQATCSEDGSMHIAAILSRVHPKSSEVAKKILEHLDRTDFLPQNKSFEPKVLTEKKALFDQFDGTISWPQDRSLEHKSLIETKTLSQSDVVKELNGRDNKAGPLSLNTSSPGGDVFHLDVQVPKANDDVVLGAGASFIDSKARQVRKVPSSSSQFSGSEFISATTSFSNAEVAPSFPGNVVGFSISASLGSNASAFPSAPESVPRSSAGEEGAAPSFGFGCTPGGGPVFSFGQAAAPAYATPSYTFGSDDRSRLSFGTLGDGAVCY